MSAGKTGLAEVPGSGSGDGAYALHQPHQSSLSDGTGSRKMRSYDIIGFNFNSANQIELVREDFVPEKMFLECRIALDATPAAYMPPLWAWIGPSGVVIRYDGAEKRNIDGLEFAKYYHLHSDSEKQLQMAVATQEASDADLLAYCGGGAGATDVIYRLNLGPAVDGMLGSIGPLSAYPSRKWRMDFNLKAAADIVQGAAGNVTMLGARLFIVGHEEDDLNRAIVSKALSSKGVYISTEMPVIKRLTLNAGGPDPFPVGVASWDATEGSMRQIWIIVRNATGAQAVTAAARNVRQWGNFDTIEGSSEAGTIALQVGIDGSPTLEYGREFTMRDLAMSIMNGACIGGSRFQTLHNNLKASGGILVLAFEDRATLGNVFGVDSGGRYVKANFQIGVRRSVTTTTPWEITFIMYTARTSQILYEGMNLVNRY